MTIPGNQVAPIMSFDVTSGGNFESSSRMIILGHGTSAGSLADGQIAPCATRADARMLAGQGSMLEASVIAARMNAPTQEIWIGKVAEVGTAEVRTLTVSGTYANGGQGLILVSGELVSFDIPAGSTSAQVAALLAAAINGYYNSLDGMSLPWTATVAASVVTLTARHKGSYASLLDIFVPTVSPGNALTGNVAAATTTAGSGTPVINGVLAAMNADAFDMIVSPFGDATNLGYLKTLLSDTSGRWSYAQQIYGHAFYARTDTSAGLTTAGLAQDNWHLTLLPRFSAGGFAEPEYVWLAGTVARIAPWLGSGANGDVSRNQTGLKIDGLTAPRDRTYWMDLATRDAFLRNGVSTWSVNSAGEVQIDKIITQGRTTNGAPDTTFRDIQRPFQIMYALRAIRAALAFEHGNKALADDNPDNLDALTTPKAIRDTIIHTCEGLSGVLENLDATLAALAVVRDTDNGNRVNVVLPLDFVNALDVLAGLARVYSQID